MENPHEDNLPLAAQEFFPFCSSQHPLFSSANSSISVIKRVSRQRARCFGHKYTASILSFFISFKTRLFELFQTKHNCVDLVGGNVARQNLFFFSHQMFMQKTEKESKRVSLNLS